MNLKASGDFPSENAEREMPFGVSASITTAKSVHLYENERIISDFIKQK